MFQILIFDNFQIVEGYEKATKSAIAFLEKQSQFKVTDVRDVKQIEKVLLSTLTPKLMSYSPYFAEQLAKLCTGALPKNTQNFDVEHIRVCKLLGSNVYESNVLQGMVVTRKAEGR